MCIREHLVETETVDFRRIFLSVILVDKYGKGTIIK